MNSSDREQLIQALQDNIHTIRDITNERIKETREWTSEFYKKMSTYTERDLNNLVEKDGEIRNLRQKISDLGDYIYTLKSTNQNNIHSLANCGNTVQAMHRDANEIHNQNKEFYGDITELKRDLLTFSNENELGLTQYLPKENAIYNVLSKSYHAIKPSSSIKESTAPEFQVFQIPEMKQETTETKKAPKWGWGK
jgi:uncharacterized coiled-coil DUF342 family protein